MDEAERTGVMERRLKDESGDPASPINSRLEGMFFSAKVRPGSTHGTPEEKSAFGDTRLLVEAEVLLSKAENLYFVDFYCMRSRKTHYVTLVMTRPGTRPDRFCIRKGLKPLSIEDDDDNPFLFEDDRRELRVATGVIVELFYTRDIDLWRMLDRRDCEIIPDIKLFGKGITTKGGIPKDPNCLICNV